MVGYRLNPAQQRVTEVVTRIYNRVVDENPQSTPRTLVPFIIKAIRDQFDSTGGEVKVEAKQVGLLGIHVNVTLPVIKKVTVKFTTTIKEE